MLGHTGKTRPPLLALLLCLGLSACSGKIPGAYRIPIQQGNVITVEMLQELKLGMDKRQVRFILGTPLVTDAFHQNRWDYYYSYQPGSGERVQQSAAVYFDDDRLIRIDANIDSRIDFHTVTHATENVLIVPRKKKGGFLAALTPAFLEKDEENKAEEKISRSLDSGFNDPQPGSGGAGGTGDTATVLDPVAGAAATIGPAIGDVGTPSEIYAPNSSGAFGATTGAWSTQTGSATEVISAETKSQSKYLEDLFKDFGAATIPEAAPVAATVSEPAADEPVGIFRNTRD